MPIFDFNCRICGTEFESIVRKETFDVQCPNCGSALIERQQVSLFSCTGVQITKRLTMDSEEKMKKGMATMKKSAIRKDRIKIL